MPNTLFIAIIIFFSLIFGFLIGFILAKFFISRVNKKIIEDAKQVLAGKKENFLEIDGKKYDATKFKIRKEDGTEVIIDLKGGGIEKNVKRKKDVEKGKVKDKIPDCPPPRKDVHSIGDSSPTRRNKKQTSRIPNRIRRFG